MLTNARDDGMSGVYRIVVSYKVDDLFFAATLSRETADSARALYAQIVNRGWLPEGATDLEVERFGTRPALAAVAS